MLNLRQNRVYYAKPGNGKVRIITRDAILGSILADKEYDGIDADAFDAEFVATFQPELIGNFYGYADILAIHALISKHVR